MLQQLIIQTLNIIHIYWKAFFIFLISYNNSFQDRWLHILDNKLKLFVLIFRFQFVTKFLISYIFRWFSNENEFQFFDRISKLFVLRHNLINMGGVCGHQNHLHLAKSPSHKNRFSYLSLDPMKFNIIFENLKL